MRYCSIQFNKLKFGQGCQKAMVTTTTDYNDGTVHLVQRSSEVHMENNTEVGTFPYNKHPPQDGMRNNRGKQH